jgi:hypothetical protein
MEIQGSVNYFILFYYKFIKEFILIYVNPYTFMNVYFYSSNKLTCIEMKGY